MSPTRKFWFPAGVPYHHGDQEKVRETSISTHYYSREKWIPDTDIYEIDDGLLIIMDLAAVKKNEIKVVVENKILSISGIRREPLMPQKRHIHQLEIDFGHFEKQFRLPDGIDAEKIEARYEDGFLYIKLPKIQCRTIDIISE